MANNKIRKYANAGRVKGGKGLAAANLFGRLSDDAAVLANQRMGTKFQDLGANKSDIIKMENGNFTGGERVNSVDRNIMLMNKSMDDGRSFESELKVLQRINEPQFRELHTPRMNEETDQRIREATQSIALNKWINGNLKNYIKKQMASPSDPVRLMMDQRADEIRAAYLADRKKGQDMLNKALQLDDPRKKANLEREARKLLKDASDHRKLALENIGHMTPDEMRQHMSTMDTSDDPLIALQEKRAKEGFPTTSVSRNKSAQAWEQLTDTAIVPTTKQELLDSLEASKKFQATFKAVKDFEAEIAEQTIKKVEELGLTPLQARRYTTGQSSYDQAKLLGRGDEYNELRNEYYKNQQMDLYRNQPAVETLNANPFIEKLDPEQKLYNINNYYSGNDIFGMDKVIDLLKKDLAAGKIRPEQLNKLTVEQAVERVGRERLKAAQAEKEARIKSMADMPVYKEYPEEGYKFVQLTKPGQFQQESDVMGHSVRGYEPPRGHPEHIPEAEGGHSDYGLGGYEAIKSGKAKIYSLRDADGNSHATIEVKQPRNLPVREYLEGLPEDEIIKFKEGVAKQGLNSESSYALMQYAEQHPDYLANNKLYKASFSPDISQIKGKQNEPVHNDYLKYVQDFVQSGKFNEVNDLHNADLRSISGIDPSVVNKLGLKIPKHLNEQQIRDLNEAIYNYRPEMGEPHLIPLPESIQKFRTPPEEGMKQGGPVAKSHHYHKLARDFGLKHFKDGGEAMSEEEEKMQDLIETMHANIADLHEKLPNNKESNNRSSAHPALTSMRSRSDDEGIRPFMSGRGNQNFGNYRAGVEVPIGPVNLRASAGSHFGRKLDTAGNLRHIGLDAPLLGGRLRLDATRDPKIGHKEYKVAYERHFAQGGANRFVSVAKNPFPAPTQEQQDAVQDFKDAARNAYYDEKMHMVSPKGKKQFALQVAANYAGIPLDALNSLGGLVAEGFDATEGRALGKMFPETFTRPVSVLNPNGERVLAHPLADKFPESPRGGSRDLTDRLGHDYEFKYSAPLVGAALDLGAPALVKGAMALPRAPRAMESGLNAVTAAARRPFNPAVLTMEAVAPDLGQGMNLPYKDLLTKRLITDRDAPVNMRTMGGRKTEITEGGQGLYQNKAGNFETNPMVGVSIPFAGDLSKKGRVMADIGTAGRELNQEMVAAHRFVPMATNQIKDATAMMITGPSGRRLTNDEIKLMANSLPNMIVTHSPKAGGVFIAPFDAVKGIQPEFLRAQEVAQAVLGKGYKSKFGKADINKDIMYRGDYENMGARPQSNESIEMRKRLKKIDRVLSPALSPNTPESSTLVQSGT